MSKPINFFLLVFGVILTGAGLATLRSRPDSWLWLLAGIAVVLLALFSDGRRKRRADQCQQAAAPTRVDELMRQVLEGGRPLQLPMPFRLVLVDILALFGGAWLLYLTSTGTVVDWRLWIAGAFFFGLGLLVLPFVWIGVGRPTIELGASGIATPKTGKIAWRDITGVFLRTVTYRGASTHDPVPRE